jgi:hypothetical protein
VGGKFEIRNAMTTAWPRQASQNVIPTEGRDGPSGGICLCEIPNSESCLSVSLRFTGSDFLASTIWWRALKDAPTDILLISNTLTGL